MAPIDRRMFFVGSLAVPLAACNKPEDSTKADSTRLGALRNTGMNTKTAMTRCDSTADQGAHFLNPGCWNNYGDTTTGNTWVFVVSGPIPTPP
jgi:hypothetical protein